MADFRTKLIMLAGAATMFAGMAFGQATVGSSGAVNATTVFVRAEGTTELLAPTTIQFGGNTAATVNLTVYLSPSLTITSDVINKNSEITATPSGAGAGAAVTGVVSGSTVTFSGIVLGANNLITINNIRVNASTLAVASGVPSSISETVFVSGTNVTPIVPNPVIVAYALNGLGAVTASGATPNTICTAVAPISSNGATPPVYSFSPNFNVVVNEGFATAFKTQADESGTAAPAGNNTANSGTRFTIAFANVPSSNVSLYVPLVITAPDGAVAKLVISATATTGASNLTVDAAVKNEPAALGAVTVANNTGTAIYEVYTDNQAAIDVFTVPVEISSASGAVTAPSTAITATVSLAPIGAAANTIPNFVNGTSTATVNGSTYGACSTTLLFPYVTNSAGFETGIAIANTSLDTLGSKGASLASTQSGTCVLSFFGNNSASTTFTNPANSTTPVIGSGGVGTPFTLTSVAGAGFTGYMIANCNFQYAHGFAYIVYNFGQNNGAAMGYVAYPFSSSSNRTLGTGGVETLGN